MVNHPNRSKRRTWHGEARKRLDGARIAVGSDLHLLEMALKERSELIEALQGITVYVCGTVNEQQLAMRDIARAALVAAGVED